MWRPACLTPLLQSPCHSMGDGRDPHGTPRTRGKKGTVHAVSLIRPARFVNEAGVEVMVADGGQGPIQVCYLSAVSEKTGAVSPHGRRQPMLTRWLHKRCEANTRKHAVQGRAGLHEEGGGVCSSSRCLSLVCVTDRVTLESSEKKGKIDKMQMEIEEAGDWMQHLHVCQLLGHNQPIRPDHGLAGGQDTPLAVGGEGNVGAASVLAAQRPLRLAMADDEDFGRGHGGVRRMWTREGPMVAVLSRCRNLKHGTHCAMLL